MTNRIHFYRADIEHEERTGISHAYCGRQVYPGYNADRTHESFMARPNRCQTCRARWLAETANGSPDWNQIARYLDPLTRSLITG